MKAMKMFVFAAIVSLSAIASANDGEGSLPDGPVPSPPGWECVAKDGVVTCIPVDQEGPIE